VRALADLAMMEQSDVVATAYNLNDVPRFGPDYLIPRPFDPRLIEIVAPAVAQAAMDSGVATRPIADMAAYRQRLSQFVYHSGSSMQPMFAAAKRAPKRVVYAEGEDERVLRAAQVVVDEGLARPLLLGRPEVIGQRLSEFGLRLAVGKDCEVVNLLDPAVYGDPADDYYQLRRRDGVSRAAARVEMRSRATLLAAMLVRQGRADAMLCGTFGSYADHLRHVRDVIGLRQGTATLAAMQMLMLPARQLFIVDTHVNRDPSAEQVAEIALLAAEEVRRFGVTPSVALLSHSSFGGSDAASAVKMRAALGLIKARDPQLAVEGEMRGDAALSKTILDREFPDSDLTTEANVLVMPNVDAANISYNLLRMAAGNGITVGGILLGAARPVHILAPSATVRRIVNMTALAVVDATSQRATAHALD
jgi:malate dehydrogenase (oxaloacetate-decarboxylating)(NADP+)